MSERKTKTSPAKLASMRRYQAKHKEYYQGLRTKWQKEHAEAHRQSSAKYYARKRLIQAEFKELAAIDCF